jgi:hypothetical protein
MKTFNVTVTTEGNKISYVAIASTSAGAFMDAADAQGDTPCAITVVPVGSPQ